MTSHRLALSARALALVLGTVASSPVSIVGQTAKAQPPWTMPRTPDGHPDFQGIWDFRTATPVERPRELAGKEFFSSDEEAAEFERRAAERINDTLVVHPPAWLDYGTRVLRSRRTSLIVDPPDGRVPALTPAARQKAAARAEARQKAEGPEAFSLAERCILFGAGPPIVPGAYNNNIQIVQTRDTVVISNEMIHDARIVPTDGRPHLPPQIRPLLGDSRGRWDGDTLVIDTTNFTTETRFRGSDENLHLTERFTRTDRDTLMYEFTVDDPTAFTARWTAALPMARSEERIYEYACHEGNYGLRNMLTSARYAEKAADEAAKKQ
jgi:hypothetical protein